MSTNEIRAFIAIELDDPLRRELKRTQSHLQAEFDRAALPVRTVRWSAPHNLHLTLQFLGNLNPSQLPPLSAALHRTIQGIPPFDLTAKGVGCFPNPQRPNNVWVGLEGDMPSAALLARRLQAEGAALGFPRDPHPFAPHLTLGRVNRDATRSERAAIGAVIQKYPALTLGTIHVAALYLMQSDLRPSGPIYSVLEQVELGKQK